MKEKGLFFAALIAARKDRHVSVVHGAKEEKRMTVKVMTLAVAVTLGALPVVAVYAKPPAQSQAGGLPAVSARVHALELAVDALHASDRCRSELACCDAVAGQQERVESASRRFGAGWPP